MLSIIRDIKLRLLERCTSTESGLFAFLGSRPGAGGPLYDGLYGGSARNGYLFQASGI